jgi:hypothetical protein
MVYTPLVNRYRGSMHVPVAGESSSKSKVRPCRGKQDEILAESTNARPHVLLKNADV